MSDFFSEILDSVRRNKLRTALTGFAVAWGIFILIVLLGAGNGIINAIASNSDDVLVNAMEVYGGYTSEAYGGLAKGRAVELNDRDMAVTRHAFAGNVDDVGADISHDGATMSLGPNYVAGIGVHGVYPNDAIINKRRMRCGRFIDGADISGRRKVVVVSDETAAELMPRSPLALPGRYVSVDGMAYRVVGVYEAGHNRETTDVYVPFSTFRTVYHSGDKAGNIVFSFHGLNSEDDNTAFERSYRAAVNRGHGAAPADESAVWIWNRFTQNLMMGKGMAIIRTALWVIGVLTLVSGIVGVSDIMLITVRERTREFGIRKAIGATPWSILWLIISESVAVTAFFGSLGMMLGVAANLYMDATLGHDVVDTGLFQARFFLNPVVGLSTCLEALALMVAAGTLAGIVPARRAARIRPIEALRAD